MKNNKDQKMQAMIDRLKREKAEIEEEAAQAEKEKADKRKTDLEKGREDGLRWAREAHYADLKRFAEYGPGRSGTMDVLIYREIVKDYSPGEQRGIGNITSWAKGWLDGVRDFWKEIKDQL